MSEIEATVAKYRARRRMNLNKQRFYATILILGQVTGSGVIWLIFGVEISHPMSLIPVVAYVWITMPVVLFLTWLIFRIEFYEGQNSQSGGKGE